MRSSLGHGLILKVNSRSPTLYLIRNMKTALKKAGVNRIAYRVEYYTKAKYKKQYPGMKYRRCVKQNVAAGDVIDKTKKAIVTFSDKTTETGKGLEAMVRWAETVSDDRRFGYSLGVHPGKKADRFCPFCKRTFPQTASC